MSYNFLFHPLPYSPAYNSFLIRSFLQYFIPAFLSLLIFFHSYTPSLTASLPNKVVDDEEVAQLRIRHETLFEFRSEDDEGFILLIRILVILFHLPTPGIFDRLKRTQKTGRAKVQLRYKMPMTNSILFLLRHVLEFVCLIRRQTKNHEQISNIPVHYPTTTTTMSDLDRYAKDGAS